MKHIVTSSYVGHVIVAAVIVPAFGERTVAVDNDARPVHQVLDERPKNMMLNYFAREAGNLANQQHMPASRAEWDRRRGEWLPSDADRAYVANLQKAVTDPAQIANWIAKPARGIKGLPFDYQYVRLED